MGVFDPSIALRAQEFLDSGNARAAAELVADSPHREHKSIRSIRLSCARQLIEAAQALFLDGKVEVAISHVGLAEKCASLQGNDAAIASDIKQSLLDLEVKRKWLSQRLENARRLAADGRFQTAIETLAPIADVQEAQLLQKDFSEYFARFARYIETSENCINNGDLVGAERHLRQARVIIANHHEVSRIEHWLGQLRRQNQVSQEPNINHSSLDRFVLQLGFTTKALIVSNSTIVIGTGSSRANVAIDTAGLHSQHALIFRHTRNRQTTYWLAQHPSHNDYTSVNGRPLTNMGSSIGCAALQSGSIIQLGKSRSEISATWRFMQDQVEGCGTATLEGGTHNRRTFASSDKNYKEFEREVDDQVHSASCNIRNHSCHFIVLAADTVRVSNRPVPGHLMVDQLPVSHMTYDWTNGCPSLNVHGGGAYFSSLTGDEMDTNFIPFPSQAEVFSDAFLDADIHEATEQSFAQSGPKIFSIKHFRI